MTASSPPSPGLLLTRRGALLSGAAGLALLGPAGAGRTLAAASGRHDVAVGDAVVTVLSDGTLPLPTSLVLPGRSRQEIEDLLAVPLPADGFVAETNVTVVSSGPARILIDCGAGANFMPTLGRLPERLEAAGIDPATITHVVLTHAHPDHLWGALDDLDEPRFPEASYVLSAREWAYWTDPDTVRLVPEAMQPMAAGAARILKALGPRLARRAPGDAVAPGVSLVDTAGHTPGHLSVLVESGGARLLVGGDVLTHERVSFERPRWEWGTDADSARAVATRAATLATLAAEDIRLLGYHLPWPGVGRVERRGPAYRWVPAP